MAVKSFTPSLDSKVFDLLSREIYLLGTRRKARAGGRGKPPNENTAISTWSL
jgi:hypothetical protein